MNLKRKLLFLLSSSMLFLSSACEDDDHDDHAHEEEVKITTPTTYTFNSRFVEGESSVSYSGQVVRNLLINDIKTQSLNIFTLYFFLSNKSIFSNTFVSI